MTYEQKKQNDNYFNRVISLTKENGFYVWPNEKETYTMKNGKLIGKKSAIRKIKNITTKSFHNRLVVK